MFGFRVFHICDESPKFYIPIRIWRYRNPRSNLLPFKLVNLIYIHHRAVFKCKNKSAWANFIPSIDQLSYICHKDNQKD